MGTSLGDKSHQSPTAATAPSLGEIRASSEVAQSLCEVRGSLEISSPQEGPGTPGAVGGCWLLPDQALSASAVPAPINAAFVFLSVGSLPSLSLLGSASTEAPGPFRGRSLLSAPGDELGPKVSQFLNLG